MLSIAGLNAKLCRFLCEANCLCCGALPGITTGVVVFDGIRRTLKALYTVMAAIPSDTAHSKISYAADKPRHRLGNDARVPATTQPKGQETGREVEDEDGKNPTVKAADERQIGIT